jgi:hypothetical protein
LANPKALPNNPYDGHMLGDDINSTETLTDWAFLVPVRALASVPETASTGTGPL